MIPTHGFYGSVVRWLAALAAIGALASACGSTETGAANSGIGNELAIITEGDLTVAVAEFYVAKFEIPPLQQLVESSDVVFIGRLVASDLEYAKYQPDGSGEGELPNGQEGANLYGALMFEVIEPLKGVVRGDELALVFESGKLDGDEPDKMIRYYAQERRAFQSADTGRLRTAKELSGVEVVVVARWNDGLYPVDGDEVIVLAHPDSIGVIAENSDRVVFGAIDPGESPAISIDEIRVAVGRAN